jgi:hypothetical protein
VVVLEVISVSVFSAMAGKLLAGVVQRLLAHCICFEYPNHIIEPLVCRCALAIKVVGNNVEGSIYGSRGAGPGAVDRVFVQGVDVDAS